MITLDVSLLIERVSVKRPRRLQQTRREFLALKRSTPLPRVTLNAREFCYPHPSEGTPPVFASSCKLLLPQPLSIDPLANCPRWRGYPRSRYPASSISRTINRSKKHVYNWPRMNRSQNAGLKLALESIDPKKVEGGASQEPESRVFLLHFCDGARRQHLYAGAGLTLACCRRYADLQLGR